MTEEEIYNKIVEELGVAGTPAWENVPPNDPIRELVRKRLEEEPDSE
jgi:hypothetical protein